MVYQIGNWELGEDSFITWKGNSGRAEFPARALGKAGREERWNVSNMIVHMAEKTWANRQDAYDLYSMAQYAINTLGINVDPAIDWTATQSMQDKILKQDKK